MQFRTEQVNEGLILFLIGRFDANWSQHVGEALEDAVRAGNHAIEINMAELTYISSAGLSTLVTYYSKLKKLGGALRVTNANDSVEKVLKLTGLATLFMGEPTVSTQTKASLRDKPRIGERKGCAYEVYSLCSGVIMQGDLLGDPSGLQSGNLVGSMAVRQPVSERVFCIGVGGFEDPTEQVTHRFGESLGLCGLAVTQPTDGSDVPDFVQTQGEFNAELHLLTGIAGSGDFSTLIRFEANDAEDGSTSLSNLVALGLDECDTQTAAFAFVAESKTVVGATLLQSPSLAAGQSPTDFPGVRDWLSFTVEPDQARHLVLIVGVASRNTDSPEEAFLTPLNAAGGVLGHFHACTYPYLSVPKGKIDLRNFLKDLTGKVLPQSVLHLVNDDRPFEGVGETQLTRGACWCGPISFTA